MLKIDAATRAVTRSALARGWEVFGIAHGYTGLIGADLTGDLRETPLVLTDDPSALPPKTGILPFEQALAAALKTRPEMSAAEHRVEILVTQQRS